MVIPGILTKKEILERRLIKDLDDNDRRLQVTSYDLSLGAQYQASDGKIITLAPTDHIIIPPYGVILVGSQEFVETDDRTAGRFDLKIRHALRGLILQVGTQIEPMYTGQLFGLLFNLSGKEVKVSVGEDIFTIEFHALTSPVEIQRREISSLSDFLQRRRISDPVDSSLTRIKGDIENSLKERLEQYVHSYHSAWEQRRTTRWAVGLSGAFLLLSLVLGAGLPVLINKMTLDRDDTLNQQFRVHQAEEQIKNEQSFQDLIKYLREHPEALEKLSKQIQSEKQSSQPSPSDQAGTENRQSGSGRR